MSGYWLECESRPFCSTVFLYVYFEAKIRQGSFLISLTCGGENVRSGSEEIRQSNCNTYISCYADLLCS
jgi:hypothetical protein